MNLNQTLLTDLYQLTMVGGYYLLGKGQQRATFDYFFRKIPEDGGFCVAAGLEQLIDYIQNIHFEPEDIHYLKSLNLFSPEVLKFFQELRFNGDLYAVPEGTLVFPQEPVVRVAAHNQADFSLLQVRGEIPEPFNEKLIVTLIRMMGVGH